MSRNSRVTWARNNMNSHESHATLTLLPRIILYLIFSAIQYSFICMSFATYDELIVS